MAISNAEPTERLHDDENLAQKGISLWPLVGYFLKLGTIGFGGPAALVADIPPQLKQLGVGDDQILVEQWG